MPEWPQSLTSYVNLIKALPHPAAVFWGSHLSLVHNFAWGAATRYHNGQGRPAAEYYRGEARSALQSAVTGRTIRIGTSSCQSAAGCFGPGPDPLAGLQDTASSHELADRVSPSAGEVFSQKTPGESFGASMVICPLLDDRGHRQGAFAQSLDAPSSQRSLDNELLGQGSDSESPSDRHVSQHNDFLDKPEKDQDEILSKALPPAPLDRHGGLVDAVSRHGHIDLKQSQLFQRFSELLPTGLAILNHNVSAQPLRLPSAPGRGDSLTRWK